MFQTPSKTRTFKLHICKRSACKRCDAFIKTLIVGKSEIEVGPFIPPGGTSWDEIINFVVGGVVEFKPDATTIKNVADANKKQIVDATKATNENVRKTQEALLNAAKAKIELASNINTRRYEDLREEERIIVRGGLAST